MPPGLAILDAPDIDSVEERNRVLAAQLLAAADLWLFVTSAARYADQVPWDFLRKAAERSAAVAIVLDRTPPDAVDTVTTHLARMLASRGLKDSPLFTVAEGAGRRGRAAAAPRRSPRSAAGCESLADDAEARAAVVRQTLDGAVRTLDPAHPRGRRRRRRAGRRRTPPARGRRRRPTTRRVARGRRGVGRRHPAARRGAGPLAGVRRHRRAAPLARDPGRLAARPGRQRRQGQAAAGRAGHRGRRVRPRDADPRARRGRGRAGRGLVASARPPGQVLLADAGEDLGRASRDFRRRAERAVRDWQADVLEMVRTEGADKRTTARFLAFGVNGLSVALMVVVFAHTAGVTGAEVGIAGGSAVLGQKLLEAVFGDQAVRRLAERARTRPRASRSRDAARRRAAPLRRPARRPRGLARGARAGCARPRAGSTTCASPQHARPPDGADTPSEAPTLGWARDAHPPQHARGRR